MIDIHRLFIFTPFISPSFDIRVCQKFTSVYLSQAVQHEAKIFENSRQYILGNS